MKTNQNYLEKIDRQKEFDGLKVSIEQLKKVSPDPAFQNIISIFEEGYNHFSDFGITPQNAYLAMRQLFVITNGGFNRLISENISKTVPPLHPPVNNTVFGDSLSAVIHGLNTNGFWIFKEKMADHHVDNLVRYAKETPAFGRAAQDRPASQGTYSDMHRLGNAIFDFDEKNLVNNEDVWAVATMREFADIARAYLKTEPILDLVTMWWSLATKSSIQEQSSAAQLYHFDLDRLRFLKFFVYLTDVSDANGPHSYVAGSHKGLKDRSLQRDGRFSDEEVKRYYSANEKKITGEKGTVFVADTAGLHKGTPLDEGERLIFQMEFSNSLFGASYTPWDRTPKTEYEKQNSNLFAKMANNYL
jgi:hypothetical protein